MKMRFLKPALPTQFSYIFGVYIGDDVRAIGEDSEGFPIITRGHVLWNGTILSTSLDQMELVSEER